MEERISRKAEFDYMLNFVEENSFDDEMSCDWLRMLWTAFCLHQGIDVDTRDYDELLGQLWAKTEEAEDYSGDWADAASFDIFMARYLC